MAPRIGRWDDRFSSCVERRGRASRVATRLLGGPSRTVEPVREPRASASRRFGSGADPSGRFAWLRCAVIVSLLCLASSPAAQGDEKNPRPVSASAYEIATRNDLLLSHLVAPAMTGDVEEWTKALLGGMPGQVGDWVTRYLDARAMANVIAETFPVEGQPALARVDQLVADCATTLGIEKPAVYVRNSPFTRLYAVQAGGRWHLVLTSALLELFQDRPDELRFVVGRELGHVKCGHAELKRKGYAVISAIQTINVAVVPDRFQNVLPLLALGRFLTWCREAEFSADRAGLLCCGGRRPAYEAIMRLQHGLRADSPWIDPDAKGFDVNAVLRTFKEWQYEPFVRFVLYAKQQPLDRPYFQERLATLKAWVDSGAYRALVDRQLGPASDQLIEVVKIQAFELAPEGQTVDPYVIVTDGDRQLLATNYASAVRSGHWTNFKPTDAGVDQPRAFRDGQPLFFEIWDADYGDDALIGGFVVYPDGRDAAEAPSGERLAEYTGRVVWDWKEPCPVSRPGHARVQVRFTRRQAAGSSATKEDR